ncbi:MAG: hypothetical protein LC792_07610 [Actinobacteria bacterium]|nr:hypothetical protein [Actinomycetota bacterium]
MLAVDGSAVSSAIAAAFFVMVAIAVLMLGFAAVCAVAGIRILWAAPADVTRWQRIGGVAFIALAVTLLLAVAGTSWSWVRYYLDGREADRASAAAAQVAQMCESQFYNFHHHRWTPQWVRPGVRAPVGSGGISQARVA